MSEKTIDTLFELLDKYKVEVPIVQRDYAQGRQDDHTKMVRYNLLKDMKSAILRKTPPLDLNFVYGKAENDKFIPIDGQQRLTTLFLLHLYAFQNDNSKTKLLRKFTYETRTSSRDFLEKLTENRAAVFTSVLPPSRELRDSDGLFTGWKSDPTIQSALTMLDDISGVFTMSRNLPSSYPNTSRLASAYPISKLIPSFKFLEIKHSGRKDQFNIIAQ